jgi:hypothetical protein
MPLKLSVTLRLTALEPPSKSYANRIMQSLLCNSLETEAMKKSAKREGRVNLSPTSIFFSYWGFVFSDVLNQVVVFFAPHAQACRRNLWRDLEVLETLRTAVL